MGQLVVVEDFLGADGRMNRSELVKQRHGRDMKDLGSPNPAIPSFLEDYAVGQTWEFGRVDLSEQSIVEFARQYDPQPFHLDPEAAKQSIFGGLIASGWHTGAASMRLFVEHFVSKTASLGSPGMNDVGWPRPVRPGDVLSVRLTILDARASRSRPDRGLVNALVETLNQDREVVMTLKMGFFVHRRP
jgi:acyl dehydratase